eukprot:GDKK01052017.1.p2 GENE.GDKK01052017.1~~GDKK01052017.1.p2  ORF type:complete len:116 (-),score=17.66 GDKK01052017.1:61-408(-)
MGTITALLSANLKFANVIPKFRTSDATHPTTFEYIFAICVSCSRLLLFFSHNSLSKNKSVSTKNFKLPIDTPFMFLVSSSKSASGSARSKICRSRVSDSCRLPLSADNPSSTLSR